jgi:succinyl-diaminopimelate desuccinylase
MHYMPTTDPAPDWDKVLIDLTSQLIERPSVSPEDAGCQLLIAEYLQRLGFQIEHLRYDDVDNLWATLGTQGPLFVFAGHTDVVPPGPASDWHTDPFGPVIKQGIMYGRGAADMKGSLAAMLTATSQFLLSRSSPRGTLGFLITSDEEDVALNGTRKVMETLSQRGTHIDYCVVGEPSSSDQLGDTIRVGRRGSLSGDLTVNGIQGHVAYPDLASNPIHRAVPALTKLTSERWDSGNDFFPATSCQISNINAGTGATNVIPGRLNVRFNFRFCPESSADSLKQRTEQILDEFELDYDIDWHLSGESFLTTGGKLIPAVKHAIQQVTGLKTAASTSGGTSDGRFIAPTGTEVVELGPCNATIHKVNEQVAVDELTQLSVVYTAILEQMLG